MVFEDLKKALSEVIMDLKPAPIPDNPIEYEYVTLEWDEKDNSKWLSYITAALKDAKTFEIHCWNEETEWIELALQYGSLKDDDWRHGKIITGDVTPEFVQMLLGLPKPTDVEIENKMTPFFNVFLDDKFQSCHYGTVVGDVDSVLVRIGNRKGLTLRHGETCKDIVYLYGILIGIYTEAMEGSPYRCSRVGHREILT